MREQIVAPGWWIAAGLVGALACASRERAVPPAGALQVVWNGADTGKLSAPAVAEWCDSLRFLEVRAIHGDTGIALVLYPADSAVRDGRFPPGKYPVLPPPRADSTRPSAAVALRWFEETSIRGFGGDTGSVMLETVGPGTGAGRFSATLRSATEGSRINIAGSFKGLTVTRAPPGCSGRPEEPDGGIEPGDQEGGGGESADTG